MIGDNITKLAIAVALWILPASKREKYLKEFTGTAFEVCEEGAMFPKRFGFALAFIRIAINIRFYYIKKSCRKT